MLREVWVGLTLLRIPSYLLISIHVGRITLTINDNTQFRRQKHHPLHELAQSVLKANHVNGESRFLLSGTLCRCSGWREEGSGFTRHTLSTLAPAPQPDLTDNNLGRTYERPECAEGGYRNYSH